MSDIGDTFRAYRRHRKKLAGENRRAAAAGFQIAVVQARRAGLDLHQCTDAHYQIRWPDGALMNIYPGNRRLYRDPKHPAPFLSLPDDWTLTDVVKAAIEEAR